MAQVQAAGVNDLLDGSLYVFRSKRSDKVKVVCLRPFGATCVSRTNFAGVLNDSSLLHCDNLYNDAI